MVYSAAVVGTGADPQETSRDGFAMGYRHASAYQRLDECELVACADVVPENAEQFAETFDVAAGNVFEDAREMARAVEPDIASVTVPPGAHAEVVMDMAEAGTVSAIHCEKPMAKTWEECRGMVRACERAGVQLTINHQRRYGEPFQRAETLLEEGAIGSLERVEFGGKNLFDAGTHQFDLCGKYTGQAEPIWVLAGIDYSEENLWFGAHNANQALVQWEYENGVGGLAATGDGADLIGCYLRLVGADGVIEIGVEDGPTLRVRRAGNAHWETVETEESVHGPLPVSRPRAVAEGIVGALPGISTPERPSQHERALEDVVRSARDSDEAEVTARHALQSTGLIFGAWESVRRRGRVDFPLTIQDNPLESMVEEDVLNPVSVE